MACYYPPQGDSRGLAVSASQACLEAFQHRKRLGLELGVPGYMLSGQLHRRAHERIRSASLGKKLEANYLPSVVMDSYTKGNVKRDTGQPPPTPNPNPTAAAAAAPVEAAAEDKAWEALGAAAKQFFIMENAFLLSPPGSKQRTESGELLVSARRRLEGAAVDPVFSPGQVAMQLLSLLPRELHEVLRLQRTPLDSAAKDPKDRFHVCLSRAFLLVAVYGRLSRPLPPEAEALARAVMKSSAAIVARAAAGGPTAAAAAADPRAAGAAGPRLPPPPKAAAKAVGTQQAGDSTLTATGQNGKAQGSRRRGNPADGGAGAAAAEGDGGQELAFERLVKMATWARVYRSPRWYLFAAAHLASTIGECMGLAPAVYHELIMFVHLLVAIQFELAISNGVLVFAFACTSNNLLSLGHTLTAFGATACHHRNPLVRLQARQPGYIPLLAQLHISALADASRHYQRQEQLARPREQRHTPDALYMYYVDQRADNFGPSVGGIGVGGFLSEPRQSEVADLRNRMIRALYSNVASFTSAVWTEPGAAAVAPAEVREGARSGVEDAEAGDEPDAADEMNLEIRAWEARGQMAEALWQAAWYECHYAGFEGGATAASQVVALAAVDVEGPEQLHTMLSGVAAMSAVRMEVSMQLCPVASTTPNFEKASATPAASEGAPCSAQGPELQEQGQAQQASQQADASAMDPDPDHNYNPGGGPLLVTLALRPGRGEAEGQEAPEEGTRVLRTSTYNLFGNYLHGGGPAKFKGGCLLSLSVTGSQINGRASLGAQRAFLEAPELDRWHSTTMPKVKDHLDNVGAVVLTCHGSDDLAATIMSVLRIQELFYYRGRALVIIPVPTRLRFTAPGRKDAVGASAAASASPSASPSAAAAAAAAAGTDPGDADEATGRPQRTAWPGWPWERARSGVGEEGEGPERDRRLLRRMARRIADRLFPMLDISKPPEGSCQAEPGGAPGVAQASAIQRYRSSLPQDTPRGGGSQDAPSGHVAAEVGAGTRAGPRGAPLGDPAGGNPPAAPTTAGKTVTAASAAVAGDLAAAPAAAAAIADGPDTRSPMEWPDTQLHMYAEIASELFGFRSHVRPERGTRLKPGLCHIGDPWDNSSDDECTGRLTDSDDGEDESDLREELMMYRQRRQLEAALPHEFMDYDASKCRPVRLLVAECKPGRPQDLLLRLGGTSGHP